MSMEQFKIRPEGLVDIQKQMLLRAIPISLIAISVGIAASYYNPDRPGEGFKVLPFAIGMALGSVALGLFMGWTRQKRLLESYTLTLTGDAVIREQHNTPTIRIAISDITEIGRQRNGSFTIKSRNPADLIGILPQIERYEYLEQALNQIRPITVNPSQPLLVRYRYLAILTPICLLAAVYLSQNKIVVGLSGTAVTGFLVWSFFQIQRSPHLDTRTKKMGYWMLLVLVPIIGTMINKLMPH